MAKVNYDRRIPVSNLTIYNKPPDGTLEVFGLYNFSGDKLTRYKNFCFKNNLELEDQIAQTTFLLKEIRKESKSHGDEFRKASTVEEAAAIFHNDIIKSGNIEATINMAYEILDRNSI